MACPFTVKAKQINAHIPISVSIIAVCKSFATDIWFRRLSVISCQQTRFVNSAKRDDM